MLIVSGTHATTLDFSLCEPSPDYIISNQVLEHEHNSIVQQIAAAQAARKPVDDLMDRKTSYEIRMNLLVTLVQAGSLSMSGTGFGRASHLCGVPCSTDL